jgi:hypothetical protein
MKLALRRTDTSTLFGKLFNIATRKIPEALL